MYVRIDQQQTNGGSMKNSKLLIAGAIISGLIAGQNALADDHGKKPAAKPGKSDKANKCGGDKAKCGGDKAKDKAHCKGADHCESKDGCGNSCGQGEPKK